MAFTNLIRKMIERGLGDFLVLHTTNGHVYLGNISYDKGNFAIKDQGLLAGMEPDPEQFAACWGNGFLGCIYDNSKNSEWESLSFNGLEECKLPVDLSATRGNALGLAENQYGDKLCDFVGSAYRGFQLMLDNHFLPVVLLKHVLTRSGESGLAVSDLRMVPLELSIISHLNNVVRKSVEKKLSYDVGDLQMNPEKFSELFGDYVPDD
jgi:hypothetical protein